MVKSMTGYAAERGQSPLGDWVWELRAVNGKALDLRMRLPDGFEGAESAIRASVGAVTQRGNVNLSLKLGTSPFAGTIRIDETALQAAVDAVAHVSHAMRARGIDAAPARPEAVLVLPGVTVTGSSGASVEDTPAQADFRALVLRGLDAVIVAFEKTRIDEGKALASVILGQIDRIGALRAAAVAAAEARRGPVADAMQAALARIGSAADADPSRIAQELALLAVKSDVTEELDRLAAHVAAARAILTEPGAVGRKLDFLCQEFMREANTLCSKSGSVDLTRIGLDLKLVIDQMREQIQNVE